MLRIYHLLIGFVLIVCIPVGINWIRPRFSLRNRDNLSVNSLSQNNHQAGKNIWTSILGNTYLPKGWQALPCNDLSLLCVSANGKNLGSVAIEISPVSKQSKFQKMLVNAGISSNNYADNRDPQYDEKVLKALRSWIDAEYSILSRKHQKNYGGRIDFSAQPLEIVKFGKLQGIRYGFAGLEEGGKVLEKHIHYVTFDGKSMYVINTAFTPEDIPSRFSKLENLAVFEPYLGAIAASLRLTTKDSLVTSQ
ncbi:hypothetical protein RINTHH_16470 [Richelia intracellularis HH01]|uniref:Uncharacterized protein n=1 Tax=Richelia intracellularis HH01 TaxID=1165094 RepID=M1WZQ8_9NOST|nr:hypothetical protein [Richelia intracellularis]CCH67802.1 hypothetical protein RINTHH_16470 [Richelia intracellularis HH01]HAE05934.1 hypothetical protein [Richelia sp.]